MSHSGYDSLTPIRRLLGIPRGNPQIDPGVSYPFHEFFWHTKLHYYYLHAQDHLRASFTRYGCCKLMATSRYARLASTQSLKCLIPRISLLVCDSSSAEGHGFPHDAAFAAKRPSMIRAAQVTSDVAIEPLAFPADHH